MESSTQCRIIIVRVYVRSPTALVSYDHIVGHDKFPEERVRQNISTIAMHAKRVIASKTRR